MDYEEKYKGALERMRYVIIPPKTKEGLQALKETVFPELSESEDEMMRKSLIEYLKTKDHECDHWVAWLEKKKEQKPVKIVRIPKFRVGDIVQRVPLEKWDRTKKITYIDEHGYRFDYSHLDDPVSGGGFSFGIEDEYELVEQKPAGWSEEDERMRKEIVDFIRWAVDRGSITKAQRERSDSWLAYLDKLKEKSEKPIIPGWSEEEVAIIDGIIQDVRYTKMLAEEDVDYPTTKEELDAYDEEVDFLNRLKSLRPQPQWKPSEEQMDALYTAAREAPIIKENGNYLYDLYEQLKNL